MKKIFVSGVGGFIGQALTKELLKKNYQLYGLVQKKKKIKGVQTYQGDLMDFKRIGQILKKVNPHFIIHLAARTEVEKSFYEPVDFSLINYGGTVNLIEKARELKNLKLFIFSSTMETYGYQEDWQPFTETTEQNPNAPYAVAKLGCEKYLQYAGRTSNFPYCILRQTNAYGRVDNDFFVVEQIITQMLKNSKEINLGYAEPYRNFLYIDDLIKLYLTILRKPNKARQEIFCTGPANALKIKDLADKIAKMIGWKGKINWNRKRKRIGEVYYLNSRADKAKRILGWQPKISLEDRLSRTILIWSEKLRLR